jgi:hypothetical protein
MPHSQSIDLSFIFYEPLDFLRQIVRYGRYLIAMTYRAELAAYDDVTGQSKYADVTLIALLYYESTKQ